MKHRLTVALLIAALTAAAPAAVAQQQDAALQALEDALPGTLINDPRSLDWQFYGNGQTVKTVQGDDIPGGKAALQITIPRASSKPYEIGANIPLTTGIKSGKDVVIGFYARTLSADTPDGNGRVTVRFQQKVAPYAGFGETPQTIGKQWRLYEISARADRSIAKGEAVVSLQLAGAKQVIEIGQTIILSDAKSISTGNDRFAQAATTDLLPQLRGKGRLITNPANRNWTFYGNGVSHEMVPSPNIPGTGGTALQVRTTAASANAHDVGALVPITGAIAEGDRLLIALLARTAPAGSTDGASKLGIRIQNSVPPYDGFGDNMLNLNPSWRLLQINTQAKSSIPAGKGILALHFGATAQAIEVGQVYVLNTSQPDPANSNP